MKLIISRKVIFKGNIAGKAHSITNQYVLEGSLEDIEHMWLSMVTHLSKDFMQEKGVGKK